MYKTGQGDGLSIETAALDGNSHGVFHLLHSQLGD
jgi:hypothetical protein